MKRSTLTLGALLLLGLAQSGRMMINKSGGSGSAKQDSQAGAMAVKETPVTAPASVPSPVATVAPAARALQATVPASEQSGPLTGARADAVELDVNVSRARLVPRMVYGFNTNNITGDYGYSDPVIRAAIADLKPGVLRFPGGSVANFYHWQTGKFDVGDVDEETGTKLEARTAGNISRLQQRRGGVVSFADFMALCNQTGVNPIIVVNPYTGTPEESAAWVREVKSKGYAVRGWEIGNEMYLPAYKDRFPTVESYIAVAKQHVAAMKAADPSIRVAVPGSPTGFHSQGEGEKAGEGVWDQVLGKESFYDGVAVHLYTYTKVGKRSGENPDQMRGYLFGSSEVGLSRALSYYHDHYGSRRLWITEWNLSNPRNPIANTQLHAVYVGDFLLGLMQAEGPVRLAAYHVLAGSGKGFPLISPADEADAGSGDVKRAAYFAFRVFGNALGASDRLLDVTIKRAPSLMGAMNYAGQRLAGVRAVALANDTVVTVLMTNRTEDDQPLVVTLGGKPIPGEVCWEAVANRNPAATNGGNTQIRSAGRDEINTRTWCGSVSQLTLPGNAVLALQIPYTGVPAPASTANDSAMVE